MNHQKPLYQELLLDHYKNPRNCRVLETPTIETGAFNPSCGDSVAFYLELSPDGLVTQATFQGAGCVISQATASLVTVAVQHKSLQELQTLTSADLLALIGIELGPVRSRCALLSLEALLEGLSRFINKAH